MKTKKKLIKEVDEAHQAWEEAHQAWEEASQAYNKARQALKEYEEQDEN